MATTITESNLKNRSSDIEITFDQVINVNSTHNISNGDDPFSFDISQYDGTPTLLQYEPGTYDFANGSGFDVATGQTIGIESTTQTKEDVTFRAATDSASARAFSPSDSDSLYIGHITVDSRSNYNGNAGLVLSDGFITGSQIYRDIEFVGWCTDDSDYSIEITGLRTGAEKIVRDVIDKRPIQMGTYKADTTFSFYLGSESRGYAQYDRLQLQDIGESALYSGKDQTEVHVTNSDFHNVGYATLRISGSTSTIDNCSIFVDVDNLQADSQDTDSDGLTINRCIWVWSSDGTNTNLAEGEGIRAGPTVENCDIVVEESTVTGGPGGIGAIVNSSHVGGATIKNTRIENNDSRSFQYESIMVEEETSTDVPNPEVTIDNVEITGSYDEGQATIEINSRDGSEIKNSCIDLPNNADGIELISTQNASISDTNINVGGTDVITSDGATVTETNITYNGSCSSPDLSSWDVSSSQPSEPEETYSTDFTNYSSGSFPSDWTERWGSLTSDWNITSSPSIEGNQYLNLDTTAGNDRRALSWDVVDNSQDVEVLGLVKYPAYNNDGIGWTRLFARGSGFEDLENGYFAGIGYQSDGNNYLLQIARYDSNTSSTFKVLENYTISDLSDTWLWIRFRVNGETLRAKHWEASVNEPSDWDISVSDSNLSSGWAGVGSFDSQIQSWDYVGFGIGGAEAPMPVDESGKHVMRVVNPASRRTVDGVNQTIPVNIQVSTDSAENIGDTQADLNLELTDLEAFYQSDLYFNYRETGSSTWNISSGTTVSGPTTYSETINSLSENTDYEFQGIAKGVGGLEESDNGSILTFTTTGILTTNLQNRWTFEDTADTTTVVDTVGTNDGTIQGGPTYDTTNPIQGDASLNFDGVDDHVDGMSDILPQDADFTFMGWVDLPSSPNSTYNTMFEQSGTVLYSYWDGDAAPRLWHEALDDELLLGTTNVRGAGETHIALRRSGDTYDLFVDGSIEDTATQSGNLGDDGSGVHFCSRNSDDRFGEGNIDDFRYYDSALTDQEITDISNKNK